MKGLVKKKKKTQITVWCLQEGKELWEGEEVKRGINVTEGELNLGGEHTLQYTDDIL